MISFEISISRKIKEFRDEKERFGHFGNKYLGTVRLRDVKMEIWDMEREIKGCQNGDLGMWKGRLRDVQMEIWGCGKGD